METKTFLETVLGGSGYYCVFANRASDNRRLQEFHETIDAVIRSAQALDEDGFDTYFALATFEAKGSRKVTNVKELRSFFLDLDCGPSKEYANQQEAYTKLRTVCKALNFPRPTVVNSGRGLHVYWALAEAVPRETWVVIAERLKAVCKKHELFADPVVTADAARILRIPGTYNHKDEPPKEVKFVGELGSPILFESFSALVKSHTPFEDVLKKQNKYIPKESDAVMDALTGSIKNRFKTIMLKTMEGKGCEQLREIVTNQANLSEPMWRAGLSIAKFCIDSSVAMHKISDRHPEYTPEKTEEKASWIRGPYTCEKFNEYNEGVCPECKHWKKIRSPITLGREIQEATEEDNTVVDTPKDSPNAEPITYTIPKYPNPYFRGKNGGVFKRGKGNDGDDKDIVVYINDLYVIGRVKDPDLGEVVVMRLHLPKDGAKEFMVPLTAVGSREEFRKHLASQGVTTLVVTELMEYTMKWVEQLQYETEADEARKQFGWTNEKGTSFVLGAVEIFGDRVEINPPARATGKLFPMFHKKGSFETWLEIMEFYNRPGLEMHQFAIGVAFGSILMEFQSINGAVFHIHSKGTGLGKTTAMLAGASIWGNPDLFMLQERDTFNSKMNRAEVYKNLPPLLDEMTNSLPKELSEFLYQVPSGMQRNRMSGQGNEERTRGTPWKLLFCSTGNTSIIERIGLYKSLPAAEAQRILEYRAEPFSFASKDETDQLATKIKENYGHAGIPYVQYIYNNLAAVKEIAIHTQIRVDEAAGLKAENRFWSALVSRSLAGIMVAKKVGLLDWDVAAIFKWSIDMLRAAKASFSEMAVSPENILTEYLAENYNNVLRIKSTDDSRKAPNGLDHLIHPEASPRMAFIGRYEYDIKKLYLLPKPLKEWCGKQQHNYAGFVDALKNGRTKAKREKIRLCRGTHINWPPVDVLTINCSAFMSDETEQSMAATAASIQKQTT